MDHGQLDKRGETERKEWQRRMGEQVDRQNDNGKGGLYQHSEKETYEVKE